MASLNFINVMTAHGSILAHCANKRAVIWQAFTVRRKTIKHYGSLETHDKYKLDFGTQMLTMVVKTGFGQMVAKWTILTGLAVSPRKTVSDTLLYGLTQSGMTTMVMLTMGMETKVRVTCAESLVRKSITTIGLKRHKTLVAQATHTLDGVGVSIQEKVATNIFLHCGKKELNKPNFRDSVTRTQIVLLSTGETIRMVIFVSLPRLH